MGQARGLALEPQHPLPPARDESNPAGATSALDVGTGNGELAGDLQGALPDVTAVELDADVLATASMSCSPQRNRARPSVFEPATEVTRFIAIAGTSRIVSSSCATSGDTRVSGFARG